MQRKRVYITGLGFVSSIGNSEAETRQSLLELKHGFSPYAPFESDPLADVTLVGDVKGFDVSSPDFEDWRLPEPWRIRRETLRGMPPHGVYAYCALLQAIESARLEQEDISNERAGMYTASAGSPMLQTRYMNRLRQFGPMRCPPTGIVSSIAGTLSFNLVANFKIRGHSCGFSSACASSGHAIGYAFDDIASGRQDRMFVVAGEDVNYESVLPFAGMRALSLETEPTQASRPFDRRRSGFVAAGGGVALLLESEEEVARRGASPYVELLGWGQSSDGHSVAMSHPEGRGLARAMEAALRACELDPGEIDYVNAHATSTLVGDASEGKALEAVFAQRRLKPKVSSTKAITGHGLSLASALEAGIVALALREGFTPGSAHIGELDPVFAPLDIPRETLPEGPRTALSNSSGFGGANVVLAFRRA